MASKALSTARASEPTPAGDGHAPAASGTGRQRPRWQWLAAAGVALACASAAVALQDGAQPPSPPRPEAPGDPPVLANFMVAVLVIGLVVGATVIPSKRGHQD